MGIKIILSVNILLKASFWVSQIGEGIYVDELEFQLVYFSPPK